MIRGWLRSAIDELVEWLRAVQRAVPGEIGCRLRNRFYGFRAGRRCRVLASVVIYFPDRLSLGDDVGISSYTQINAAGEVQIGRDTLIGPGCVIWSTNHRYGDFRKPIRQQGYDLAKVVIGDNCWIAARCVILPGVSLGDGTVVAAGSVVTRSFGPGAVIAGVPARQIASRDEGPVGTD